MAIEFLIGNNFLGIFSTQHPLTPNPVLETFHVIQISFSVRRGVVYEICFFFPPLSSRPFLLYPFFSTVSHSGFSFYFPFNLALHTLLFQSQFVSQSGNHCLSEGGELCPMELFWSDKQVAADWTGQTWLGSLLAWTEQQKQSWEPQPKLNRECLGVG